MLRLQKIVSARYSAYLGHHCLFTSAAQVWAFASLDMVSIESGDYRRLGRITRKGPPGLRDTLYLIGRFSSQYRLHDLAVREPDIEATIRRIYEERLLEVKD